MRERQTDVVPAESIPATNPPSNVGRDGEAWGQWLFLFATWGILAAAFWGNDGLWFQGDAPRHALNGIFWRDLLGSGTRDPLGYAWSYFARYPALTIIKYPPVYHLFSAIGYAVFGLTPLVPKCVSLLGGLALGTWLWHWLRRWVAPEAGWLAASLFLMPGIHTWMHAGMTNMLATAFAMGALYHLRRALEEPAGSRQLKVACALAVLALLTHPLTGIIVPVGLAWILQERRLKWILRPAVLRLALLVILLMLPIFVVLYLRGGNQFQQANLNPLRLIDPWSLRFYFWRLPRLTGVPWLVATGLALLGLEGCRRAAWTELRWIVSWWVICQILLILIWAKDNRYALICLPPFVIALATGCCAWKVHLENRVVSGRWQQWIASGVAVLFVLTSLVRFPLQLPEVRGMREVAATICQIADGEPVLYYGQYDGLLIYYVRLNDPQFREQVIPLQLWLGPNPDFDRCRQMLIDSGVRWLIIEGDPPQRLSLPPALLSQLQQQPWVHHRETLTFQTIRPRPIEVYELQLSGEDTPQGSRPGAAGMAWQTGDRISTPIQREID